MDERPAPPPEGQLIAEALRLTGMSIRTASAKAGISYGRWRQITSGYQNISPGVYGQVKAPAATLARMAEAVGVTPERLETEGQRPDAAKMLREITAWKADQDKHPAGQAPPPAGTGPKPPDVDGFTRPAFADRGLEALAREIE